MARTYRLGIARRAFNAALARSLKLGIAPPLTYLLTTRGRRSGELRTTPVTLVEHAGARWLVAPYGDVGWVHNARAAGRVTLTRGRESKEYAVVEAGPAEAAPVLRKYLRSTLVVKPFFDAGLNAPEEAFAAEAHRHPVFRLDA